MKLRLQIAVLCLFVAIANGCAYDHVGPEICFESEVLPVFVTYCSTSGCHNQNDRVAGYNLTSYRGIMDGVKPGNAAGSEAVSVMGGQYSYMPPRGYPRPSSDQIATIRAWVKAGAVNSSNCNVATCDTSAVVSYASDIVPMMQTYCTGCHSGTSPSAGLDMGDLTTIRTNTANGRIQGSLIGDPRYIAMPPSGNRVSSCTVDKINKWVAAGSPNN